MDHLQNYKVKFNSLKVGTHHFKFKVDSAFFEATEGAVIEDGDVTIGLDFKVNSSFFILDFKLDGFIRTNCDRCSEDFNLELIDDHQLIVKYSSEKEEEDEHADVMYITEGDIELELAQVIYEYIVLSLPMMKIHPDDENGDSTCNPEMLKYLESEEEESEEEKPATDPRWEELKKLKK